MNVTIQISFSTAGIRLFRLSLLWTLCLAIAPLLIAQGVWAKKKIPRLPEAGPPNTGSFGEGGKPLYVIGIGDSVIAGVGCNKLAESVTASFAKAMSNREDREVQWSAWGCNGDRIREVIEKIPFIPRRKSAYLLVSVGVNDVTGLTSLMRWQLEISALVEELKGRFHAPVLMLGVPPMGRFTGLPQPLRFALGVRAKMLDNTLKRSATLMRDVYWIDTDEMFDEALLATDGYHPSAAACSLWAQRIANRVDLKNELSRD